MRNVCSALISDLPSDRHRTVAAVNTLLMYDTSRAGCRERRAAPATPAACIVFISTAATPAAEVAAAAAATTNHPSRLGHRFHPGPPCLRFRWRQE